MLFWISGCTPVHGGSRFLRVTCARSGLPASSTPHLSFSRLYPTPALSFARLFGRGAARPGSGRSGRGDGRMGRRLLQRATSSSRSASLCPACRWLMALPVGSLHCTTARHGPRVAHRVTRHRAVLLARGPRGGSRPLSR